MSSATVNEPDSNTLTVPAEGGNDQAAGGDAHDVTGNGAFENNAAVVGLTSSIDEFVHVGREPFMQVVEEPLGGVVVLQVECDVNGMLYSSGVRPPHNENIAGLTEDDPNYSDEVELAKVGLFERLLKTGSGDANASWAVMTGGASGNQKTLYAQLRSFLGDFFDHDKEMNAIVAQTDSATPSALVMLDDEKIKTELTDLKAAVGEHTFTDTTDADGKFTNPEPKDRKCLASNLLSVRQVAQVLEAFAAMGVGNSNSRVIRTSTEAGNEYKYQLHEGDSIIGETRIYDADAVDATKQYSQAIKVQIVQSATGAFSGVGEQL